MSDRHVDRVQHNEALALTLLELSRKIRALQKANHALRVSRAHWREIALHERRRLR